jgi:ATP/maltotriose-dependent transcriptional regulator MalT
MQLSVPADWYPFMFAFYIAEALEHAGRFTEAARLSAERYQEGIENRSLEQQAMFRWQLAKAVSSRGHITLATQHARAAISIYRQLGRAQFIDFSLIYLAQALALGGQTAEAQHALEELDRLGVNNSYFMGVDLFSTQGWVAASSGNLRQARDLFLRAADTGEDIGDLVGALAALHGAARIGYATQVRERVTDLASSVEGPFAQARAMHVDALADSNAQELMQASVRFETMGAMLLAAEAAADCAVASARQGDSTAQSALDRQHKLVVEECPAADTPALRAVEIRSRLKHVEWEAAHLAATGLSSREIARELELSVRTIDNRLQSVYGKLLITSRKELTSLMKQDSAPR